MSRAWGLNIHLKKIDFFLFDLDDTLLDFQKSSELSFFIKFKDLNLQEDAHAVYTTFCEISHGLWKQYSQGEVERSFLKTERFRRTFAQHNISYDPDQFSQMYLDGVCENVVSVPGALKLLQSLRNHGKSIGVVTNGISEVQNRRLEKSPLKPFFDFVFTSDNGRRPKPAPDLFKEAYTRWGKPNKDSVLMIGDNLVCDILGAHNFGFKTCWFNPQHKQKAPDIHPSFEVQSLEGWLL